MQGNPGLVPPFIAVSGTGPPPFPSLQFGKDPDSDVGLFSPVPFDCVGAPRPPPPPALLGQIHPPLTNTNTPPDSLSARPPPPPLPNPSLSLIYRIGSLLSRALPASSSLLLPSRREESIFSIIKKKTFTLALADPREPLPSSCLREALPFRGHAADASAA